MKIAHESMNSIHRRVDKITDYNYILVHLLDKSREYCEWASNSIKMTILDNSVFELGKVDDWVEFSYWVRTLSPTFAVIPDVLDSADETLDNIDVWFSGKWAPKYGRYMAVLQGKTIEDLDRLWTIYQCDPRIHLVGISFDSAPFLLGKQGSTQDETFMLGRQAYISKLTERGTRKPTKPIHLLGCSLPQEIKAYRNYPEDIILSIDTSSPVVHGYHGVRFTENGVPFKVKQKLDTLIDSPVAKERVSLIMENIKTFRKYLL